MRKNDIILAIGSYETRLDREKEKAVTAIREDSFVAAQTAIGKVLAYSAVIDELNAQLDNMEA